MPNQDRDARFAELFRKHFRQIFGYVYIIVRDHADSEDVMQQTSVVLWKKFDEYRPGTNFMAWACSVARLEALDFLKTKHRHNTLFSTAIQLKVAANMAAIPADRIDFRAAALEDCIEKLPERQRHLVWLYYGGIKNVAEIAQEIGRSSHSIYSSLNHIRKKLFDCIDQSIAEVSEK